LSFAVFRIAHFCLATPGLLAALSATRKSTRAGKFAMAGLAINGVTLAIPVLLLVVAVGRLLVRPLA
jgi:hypothetical protein